MRGHEGRVPPAGWYGPDGGREEGEMRGHVPHLGQLVQSLHHPALSVAVTPPSSTLHPSPLPSRTLASSCRASITPPSVWLSSADVASSNSRMRGALRKALMRERGRAHSSSSHEQRGGGTRMAISPSPPSPHLPLVLRSRQWQPPAAYLPSHLAPVHTWRWPPAASPHHSASGRAPPPAGRGHEV